MEFALSFVKNLKHSVLKDLSYISEFNFHQLWQSVQLKNKINCVALDIGLEDYPLTCFKDTLKPNDLQALALNKPLVILSDESNLLGVQSSE